MRLEIVWPWQTGQWREIIALLRDIKGAIEMSVSLQQQMDAAIAELQTEVTSQKGTLDSAKTLIEGFAAALKTAINNSLNSGATEAEIASVQALHDQLTGNTQPLADAVAANPLP